MTSPIRFSLLAALTSFALTSSALAQEEVPMTPTPAPSPAISPIPTYPEGGAREAAEVRDGVAPASTSGTSGKVRIDSAGMFGAGFHIGNTSTGANGKIWLGGDLAAQVSVGSGALGNNLRFQLDVLYSFYRWDAEDGLYSLPFYVGVGGLASVYWKYPWPDDRTDAGLRAPIGMSIVIPDNPVEIFFEVAPAIAIYHDDVEDEDHAVFFVDGAMGVRFYF